MDDELHLECLGGCRFTRHGSPVVGAIPGKAQALLIFLAMSGKAHSRESLAGLLWGARVGVQFSLSLVVLKALPVLIIGGFDSIAGAIVGGLIVGATEKLTEVYVGEWIGGGLENWFPYALAVGFLLMRPVGLFGDRAIERV